MRLFNLSIEEELRQSKPNVLKLLLKSCIRIALVKDVATNALKTPCWFMIVNLVALDVLRSKLPSIPRNHSLFLYYYYLLLLSSLLLLFVDF